MRVPHTQLFGLSHPGFSGLNFFGFARIFRLSGLQTSPVFVKQLAVNPGTLSVSLPSLSVSTIEILRDQPHVSP
jgi:hypothetical protein